MHEQASDFGGGSRRARARLCHAHPEFGRRRLAPGLSGLGTGCQRLCRATRLCRPTLWLVWPPPLLAAALSGRLPLRLLSLLALPLLRLVTAARLNGARQFSKEPPL